MSVWLLLRNAGSIISLFKVVSGLVSSTAKNKRVPQGLELKPLFDALEDLLDRGVIDIPDVDEVAVSTALKEIEKVLCPEVVAVELK